MEKYAKIIARGSFLVENEDKINYDLAFETELPLVEEEKAKTSENKAETADVSKKSSQPAQRIDPLEGILKYDLKGNIAADLSLKEKGQIPDIKGFLKFDKLSLKVDGKKLPDSHGQFDFSGKKIVMDSKLFITPASFFAITGKVNNLAKQDF